MWTYLPRPCPGHLSRTQITARVVGGLAKAKLQRFDPRGLDSQTAYEGRVCLANSVKFFSGKIVNPLKEQTVSKRSDTIYIPTGKMLFPHEAHLFFKVDQATSLPGKILLAVILIYAVG